MDPLQTPTVIALQSLLDSLNAAVASHQKEHDYHQDLADKYAASMSDALDQITEAQLALDSVTTAQTAKAQRVAAQAAAHAQPASPVV